MGEGVVMSESSVIRRGGGVLSFRYATPLETAVKDAVRYAVAMDEQCEFEFNTAATVLKIRVLPNSDPAYLRRIQKECDDALKVRPQPPVVGP
jgi:hypothetical protein